jgi:hypothetical protein
MKHQRTLDNAATLESRYNKALVCSQLKGLFEYKDDQTLYRDANKIAKAWEGLPVDKDARPRFFNVREIMQLQFDLFLLVSSYGKWMHEGYDYDVLLLTHSKHTLFGVPVNKAVLKHVGDHHLIARIIIQSGIMGLMGLIHLATERAEGYQLKNKLQHNHQLLDELSKGLYDGKLFGETTQL